MTVWAIGHDIVDMSDFEGQLSQPGQGFHRLFSQRELRQAGARANCKGDSTAVHLAAKWAGKEAVLKAWSQALGDTPNPYTIDNFPWVEVEILDDSRGRPQVVCSRTVEQQLMGSVEVRHLQLLTSLSHDGPMASAVVLLVGDR